jgi:hypothetical protein
MRPIIPGGSNPHGVNLEMTKTKKMCSGLLDLSKEILEGGKRMAIEFSIINTWQLTLIIDILAVTYSFRKGKKIAKTRFRRRNYRNGGFQAGNDPEHHCHVFQCYS